MSDQQKPTLLVLAAGMGSRYKGLKQLDQMGPSGETILDFSVFDALRAGFGKVVFVIRKEFDEIFREKIGSRFSDKIEVDYAYQELDALPEGFTVPEGREKPWGTGHAILCAESKVSGPFVVINADDFYGDEAFRKVVDFFQSENVSDSDKLNLSMVAYYLKNTLTEHGSVARGVCSVDQNGNLLTVEELTNIEKSESGIRNVNPDNERDLSGDEIVSMNFWGFTPEIFSKLREQFAAFLNDHGSEAKSEFYIPFAVDELIQEGKADVKVLECGTPWFGVTYPEDRDRVVSSIQALVQDGAYPEKLWS